MTTMTSPAVGHTYPVERASATTVTRTRRRRRARAVGVAVAASSLLYLGARALGTDFVLTDPGATEPHPLILPEIAVFALVFGLLGWGSLALLERLTRHARTVWSVLAGTVLVASFIPVFIERATVDTRIMLCLIHVAVAAALLPMLRHRAPTRAR
ncbi:DUF6069 family protein [Micromonospora sp. NPDC049559]|uniref:DUF6069 family protein n=1 Tax=Micromonospora sp. NPDC049559 TaxID=3155923 RepID=UPI00342600C0